MTPNVPPESPRLTVPKQVRATLGLVWAPPDEDALRAEVPGRVVLVTGASRTSGPRRRVDSHLQGRSSRALRAPPMSSVESRRKQRPRRSFTAEFKAEIAVLTP